MIGVFDSGYGGLTILRKLTEELPEHSFVYLGDNARAPYGDRDPEEIFAFTRQGIRLLFHYGASLVILACNTSSANALRRIQQETLKDEFPGKRVLGILAPTVEAVTGSPWNGEALQDVPGSVIGVLATDATVRSGAYEREIKKRNPAIRVVEQSCPLLVPLIEQAVPDQVIRETVGMYLHTLMERTQKEAGVLEPDAVLLGCTHYTLITSFFREKLGEHIAIYDQPSEVAKSLRAYLERHPDFAQTLERQADVRFFTSGDPERVSVTAKKFFGSEMSFSPVE